MPYDIELIELACDEWGLPYSKVGDSELRINIAPDVEMLIANTDDDDTYWGFIDVSWHTHDELALSHGVSGYRTYMPDEMLLAWAKGDILLTSLHKDGKLVDRWFSHKGDGSDLEHIELGEAIHYTTASNKTLKGARMGSGLPMHTKGSG